MKRLLLLLLSLASMLIAAEREQPFQVTFTEIGVWPGHPGGAATAIAHEGDHVYVGVGFGGVMVIDVSDPTSPRWVSSYKTELADDVAVANGLMAVADYYQGVKLVDVTDPRQPRHLTNLPHPTGSHRVIFSGNRLLVGLRDHGVRCYNIANHAQPVLIFEDLRQAVGGALLPFGNLLVYQRGNYLNVVDPITGVKSETWTWGYYPSALASRNNKLYLLGSSIGLARFDMTNPFAPVWIDHRAPPGYEMQPLGNQFISIHWAGEVRVRAIDADGNMRDVSQSAEFPVADLAVNGNFVYAAANNYGLRIFDYSVPAAPRQIGHFDTTQGALVRSIAFGNGALYVGSELGGVHVLEEPQGAEAWTVIGRLPFGTPRFTEVAAEPNRLYVNDRQGIFSYDASVPSNLRQLSMVPREFGDGGSIQARDGIVYANGWVWPTPLVAIDFRSPESPDTVATATINSAYDLALSDDHMVVADNEQNAVRFFPIPPLRGRTWTSVRNLAVASPSSVAVNGRRGLVGQYGAVSVMDMRAPTGPEVVATRSAGASVVAAEIHGNVAFYLDTAGLKAMDMLSPSQPVIVGEVPGSLRYSGAVAIRGNLVYFSDADVGLRVMRFSSLARIAVELRGTGGDFTQVSLPQIEWTADGIFQPDWEVLIEREGQAPQPMTATVTNPGSGLWGASVTLPISLADSCDYRLRVRDRLSGAEAASSTFCLQIVPHLQISSTPGRISLRWPARFTNLRLHQSTRPDALWEAASVEPLESGGYQSVNLDIGSETRFFTLMAP